MQETELYAPVKELLENMGYSVKAEVGDCDAFGVLPDGSTAAVEMKLRLNLDVIIQAVDRQKLADKVYIAVPSPKKSTLKRWNSIGIVIRRLGIGLITVKERGAKITFEPREYDMKAAEARNKGRRKRLETEFLQRHGDQNTGGTNGKTVTVYRENAILIAALAEKYGSIAFSDIGKMAGIAKARDIVNRNYYGWFKAEDDEFGLTDRGKSELSEYRELADKMLKEAEGL